MHKIILYIISVLTVFTSCTTTDVPDKVSLQPQVMNDSLLTTMPGDLLLIDDYLVWSDPFSDNKFLHVVLPMENISVLWGKREKVHRNL